VILSNVDVARLSNIARDLSSMVFGEVWDMPIRGRTVTLDGAALGRLEGDYRLADSSVVTVRNQPDYLTAQLKGRFTAGLIPLSETEFFMPLAEGRVTFTLGSDGEEPRSTSIREGRIIARRARPRDDQCA